VSLSTYLTPLLGGTLIGLSAAILWLSTGRIAGISGIVGGTLQPRRGDTSWRVTFILGLLSGGVIASLVKSDAFAIDISRSTGALIAAGLLVGFGTRMGSGCTSGHGVCGVARFSRRSLTATMVFMVVGVVTASVVNHVLGGTL
jgi:uncharacterized membrane protein YedE/YeeE